MDTINLTDVIFNWLVPIILILLIVIGVGLLIVPVFFWFVKTTKAYKKGGWDEVLKQQENKDDWPPF